MEPSTKRDECLRLLRDTAHVITYQLASFGQEFERTCPVRYDPPFTKKEAKLLERFLVSCSLYQTDPEIRRRERDTIGPSEFLAALEHTVAELQRAEETSGPKKRFWWCKD